jgi:hypothetical protein
MNYKYWMIHNPQLSKPTVRHETIESAMAEAARLAETHAGQTFYLLEAVSCFCTEKPKVHVSSCEHAPRVA